MRGLKLGTGKVIECCKQSLLWHSSVSESNSMSNIDYGGSAQKVSLAPVLEAIWVIFCQRIWLLSIFPKNVSKAVLKINGCLFSFFVEDISRQHNIESM